ncbi:MAG TPA: hypothetical protein ENK06_10150 [Gammaproteobacteria bacterium]|nr:hypothetical protein [Gammaproteobacteria bacterium]
MAEIPQISPLEKDLLTELFNLGIGRAASSLSRMVHQEILLSVPDVRFAKSCALAELLKESGAIISIAQTIHGPFDAKAILLFEQRGGLEVVKQILGAELDDNMLVALQEEALSETGNVVLNACVGTLSTSMGYSFELDIPVFNHCSADQLLALNQLTANESVLLININMALKTSEVDAFLAFVVDETSFEKLKAKLSNLISNLKTDEDTPKVSSCP